MCPLPENLKKSMNFFSQEPTPGPSGAAPPPCDDAVSGSGQSATPWSKKGPVYTQGSVSLSLISSDSSEQAAAPPSRQSPRHNIVSNLIYDIELDRISRIFDDNTIYGFNFLFRFLEKESLHNIIIKCLFLEV